MSSFATIRQVFYGIVVIAGAMTIFMYNWLDRYFEQKQKIQLAAIQAFEQNIGTLKYRRLSPSDFKNPEINLVRSRGQYL